MSLSFFAKSVLVFGMLISGSINTLSKRQQNQSYSIGMDGKKNKHRSSIRLTNTETTQALLLSFYHYNAVC